MDTMARALLAAASIVESRELDSIRDARYAGWSGELGSSIMKEQTLDDLHTRAMTTGEPSRASGHQEMLENLVARHIERAR
jgi:xylose isomerase